MTASWAGFFSALNFSTVSEEEEETLLSSGLNRD